MVIPISQFKLGLIVVELVGKLSILTWLEPTSWFKAFQTVSCTSVVLNYSVKGDKGSRFRAGPLKSMSYQNLNQTKAMQKQKH